MYTVSGCFSLFEPRQRQGRRNALRRHSAGGDQYVDAARDRLSQRAAQLLGGHEQRTAQGRTGTRSSGRNAHCGDCSVRFVRAARRFGRKGLAGGRAAAQKAFFSEIQALALGADFVGGDGVNPDPFPILGSVCPNPQPFNKSRRLARCARPFSWRSCGSTCASVPRHSRSSAGSSAMKRLGAQARHSPKRLRLAA